MIGESLTLENLLAIYEAMSAIKDIDKSEYFINYFIEVKKRIAEQWIIEAMEQYAKKSWTEMCKCDNIIGQTWCCNTCGRPTKKN